MPAVSGNVNTALRYQERGERGAIVHGASEQVHGYTVYTPWPVDWLVTQTETQRRTGAPGSDCEFRQLAQHVEMVAGYQWLEPLS